LIPLGVLVLGPLFRLEATALKGNAQGFRDLLDYPNIGRIVWNTLALAVGSLIVALVLGTLLAFCVSRSPRRIRKWLAFVPLLTLIVPGVASTIGWVFLLSPRAGYLNAALRSLGFAGDGRGSGPIDVFSIEWIVLLTGITFSGYVYLFVRNSMEALGTELEAAAKLAGASDFRAFITVTLPLVRPALVYSSGIVLLLGVGQFTNPLLLGTAKNIEVLTTVLYRLNGSYPINYGLAAALSAPILVVGIGVMLMQQRSIGEQARYAVLSGKSSYTAAKGSWLATIPILLFGVIALALPAAAIILVAVSPYWSGKVDLQALTSQNITAMLGNDQVLSAVRTTFTAIAVALAIVVPIGFTAALAMTKRIRGGRITRWFIDLFVSLPLAMPAAIFGFAVAYTYGIPPLSLYGTTTIIIIAYVTLMIPHAMRPQLSSLLSIGKEYSEASSVSGASRWRTLWAVELPLVKSGVAVACMLVIILLSHEFAASVMVIAPDTQTIGTLLYERYKNGIYPQVAGLALLMIVVTLAALLIVSPFAGRKDQGK
jgi:iron(III) transport system permease protein